MKTYQTIQESIKTDLPVIIIKEDKYVFNGSKNRSWITVKKANGTKLYKVVRYENGEYSSPITCSKWDRKVIGGIKF